MPPLCRANRVGSILRAAYLHPARQVWKAGQLTLPEFKGMEDQAVNEASQYLPSEQLALSTQCGFASVAPGNPLSPEVQEQKRPLVVGVAQLMW